MPVNAAKAKEKREIENQTLFAASLGAVFHGDATVLIASRACRADHCTSITIRRIDTRHTYHREPVLGV